MVCDYTVAVGQTPKARRQEIAGALDRLLAALTSGATKLVVGSNGAITFANWADRKGIADACAYKTLSRTHAFTMRQLVAKAEIASGHKISQLAINSGLHTHDGKTWHPGH